MSSLTWIEKYDGYLLSDAQKRYDVMELNGGGYLVLNWTTSENWLKFAVLDFHSSDSEMKNIELRLQFHGEGPSGNLRECRHTWWGEDGYLFYPSGTVITSAFEALSEFFDDMKLKESK